MVHGEVAVFLVGTSGMSEIVHGQDGSIGKHPVSLPAAQWVIDHAQLAGAGTNTLPNACAVFIPLVGTNSCVGAVAIRSKDDNAKLLELFANFGSRRWPEYPRRHGRKKFR